MGGMDGTPYARRNTGISRTPYVLGLACTDIDSTRPDGPPSYAAVLTVAWRPAQVARGMSISGLNLSGLPLTRSETRVEAWVKKRLYLPRLRGVWMKSSNPFEKDTYIAIERTGGWLAQGA